MKITEEEKLFFKKSEEIAKSLIQKVVDQINEGLQDKLDEIYTDLCYIFLWGTKYDIKIIDVGYDISTHPVKTKKTFKIEDYKTVGDFIQESTQNTIATYQSGSGLSAATYEDDIQDDIQTYLSNIIQNIIEEKITEKDKEDDLNDYIFDNILDNLFDFDLHDTSIVENIIKPYPFKDMIDKYFEFANKLRTEEVKENFLNISITELKQ